MKIVLIVHDVRSAFNVGSLLRTADGLGIEEVFLTGFSPYPEVKGDTRLPHVRVRAGKRIRKTALGAEDSLSWSHRPGVKELIAELKAGGYRIAGLEQVPGAKKLPEFKPDGDIALIVGNEAEGLDKATLKLTDFCLEIPMLGQKESFNVSVAGAIALYQLRWPNRV